MREDKRCPLLNDEGLCDIVIKYGEEHLCLTCANFPRVCAEHGDYLEYGVNNACSEVVNMIRKMSGQMTFEIVEDTVKNRPRHGRNFTDKYYACREMAIDLLQIIDIPLWIRIFLIYQFASKVNIGSKESIQCMIEQYNNVDFIFPIYQKMNEIQFDVVPKLQTCLSLVERLANINQDSYGYPKYMKSLLEWISTVEVDALVVAWNEYQSVREEAELFYENIMVNSLFQFGFSECDDEAFFPIIELIVLEYSMITFIHFMWWLYNEKKRNEQEENEIISYIARKIEHISFSNCNMTLNYLMGSENVDLGQILLWIC